MMKREPADDEMVRRLFHKVTTMPRESLTAEEGAALITRIYRDQGVIDAHSNMLRGLASTIQGSIARLDATAADRRARDEDA